MLCKVKILMLIIHLLWINCRCASRITDRHNMYSIACCMCSDRRGGRRYNFLLSKCKDTYIFHAVTLGMPTHRCDGALHVLQVFWRRGDDAAGGGEVTQQAAGSAIWRVHGAQEAPRLRQQLAHCRCPQLREIRAPVDRPEV